MKPKSLNPKCANPKKNYFLFYINLKKKEKKDIGNTYDEIRKILETHIKPFIFDT